MFFKAEQKSSDRSMVSIAPYGVCNGGAGSGNFGHSGRPGMVGGSGKGGGLAGFRKEIAKKAIETAGKNEKAITSAVKSAVEAFGGKMEGLDFRQKTEGSLLRKLKKDEKKFWDKFGVRTREAVKAVAEDTHDNLRYTGMFDENKYSKGFNSVKKELEKQGFEFIKVKNTWNREGGYQGVNTELKNKEGYIFELQFHTAKSWKAKDDAHKFYEIERSSKVASKIVKAQQDMANIFNSVPIPSGVEKIKSFKYGS